MWSWSTSVANLPAEGFDAAFKAHCDEFFKANPPKPFVKEAFERQLAAATQQVKDAVKLLLEDGHAPAARTLTRDEKAANEQAKKEGKDELPHAPPGLRVSVSIGGHVPSGEPGDHAKLSVSVSAG